MEKYTFLAKNPRFCMQDRKITIAGKAKTHTETYTINKDLQGNNNPKGDTAIFQAGAATAQNNAALCPIPHHNTGIYHYKQYKSLL